MQNTEEPISTAAGYGAVILAAAMLALWRLFYPVTDAALMLLLVLALVIWRGTFLRIYTRRSVWRTAIWRPGSVLSWLLTGRFLAHFAGITAAAIAVPTLAHYVLGASDLELAIAGGIILCAGLFQLWLAEAMVSQLRGPLALPMATPAAFWVVGLAGTAALLWVNYTITPAPQYLTEGSLADTIAAAQASLPQRDTPAAQVLAGVRSFEAASWWLSQTEVNFAGTKFGLIFLLLHNALVAFSLSRLACDAVSAAAQVTPEGS